MHTLQFNQTTKAVVPAGPREADGTVYVRGFASIAQKDRDGDIFDPLAFDLEQFKTNPQLFVNHKRWKRKDGNEVNAGLVEDIWPVRVERVADSDDEDPEFNVFDLRNGEQIAVVKNSEGFNVQDGDRGLYAVAHVVEPDVVELVQQKRLNTFSWKGTVFEKSSTGEIVNIDIHEVSLVNVPAGQRALFAVGKAAFEELTGALVVVEGSRAFLLDSEMSTPTLIDADDKPRYAVAVKGPQGEWVHLLDSRAVRTKEEAIQWASVINLDSAVIVLEATGKQMTDGMDVYRVPEGGVLNVTESAKELSARDTKKGDDMSMTDEDRDLFARLDAVVKNAAELNRSTPDEKGGDQDMTDEDRTLLKSIGESVASLGEQNKAILETQQAQSARLDAVEKSLTKEDGTDNATTDDATKAKETAAVDDATKAKETATVEDAAKVKEDDELAGVLSGIAKSLETVAADQKEIRTTQETFSKRLNAIEQRPAQKSAAVDGDDDGDEVHTQVKQKLHDMKPEQRSRARRGALAHFMIPENILASR